MIDRTILFLVILLDRTVSVGIDSLCIRTLAFSLLPHSPSAGVIFAVRLEEECRCDSDVRFRDKYGYRFELVVNNQHHLVVKFVSKVL